MRVGACELGLRVKRGGGGLALLEGGAAHSPINSASPDTQHNPSRAHLGGEEVIRDRFPRKGVDARRVLYPPDPRRLGARLAAGGVGRGQVGFGLGKGVSGGVRTGVARVADRVELFFWGGVVERRVSSFGLVNWVAECRAWKQ